MSRTKETVGTAQGRRTNLGFNPTQVKSAPITLAEAGVNKNFADRARKLAAVPEVHFEDQFEEEIDEWRDCISASR